LPCSIDDLGPITHDPEEHDRIVPGQEPREQNNQLDSTEARAKRTDIDKFKV